MARRRREHERQAVVYGVLVAVLAVVGLGALAIFTGAVDAPFARGFTPSDPEDPFTPPCLPAVEGQPDGALPLAYGDVHVNILNATGPDGVAGIAAANRTVLFQRGFAINSVGNHTPMLNHSELRFGEQGIVAAYTLALQFPRMRLVMDAREDATVDLLVGLNFDRPLDQDAVSTGPLTNMDGCKPAAEITKLPAPTVEPPAQG
ncbi:LytR family transcriptional regulator [Xylanimonas protaetiae]|uniref:LytR family transcriptional regulator n=1 Tax=Xylanimonas protaetiae TaxID=2509457 RepID=A0A4P6FDP8_9MICO|nr:LytR family transcriptional regulator [Xylanimonas protaetiae]